MSVWIPAEQTDGRQVIEQEVLNDVFIHFKREIQSNPI